MKLWRRRERTTTADPAERLTFVVISVVLCAVPGLCFVFSFGNVWDLAARLNVPTYVQPLVAPAVDLSVTGLFVGLSYLTLRGIKEEDLAPARKLLHLSGFFTLALNCAGAVADHELGRAAFDAVGPTLLIGWGHVGPVLLRQVILARTLPMIRPVPDTPPANVPQPGPDVTSADVPPEEPGDDWISDPWDLVPPAPDGHPPAADAASGPEDARVRAQRLDIAVEAFEHLRTSGADPDRRTWLAEFRRRGGSVQSAGVTELWAATQTAVVRRTETLRG